MGILEPEEGKYQFDYLEEIINRLYDNGIYTNLATPTGAMPNWMTQKYPEVMQTDENGIQNYQEKDGKSENNKSLYAFCCKKEISRISYCDHNLRYVILHLNGNRFCIFVTGIYHLKNMILFIHFRNHITVCFRISLIQNRITNAASLIFTGIA